MMFRSAISVGGRSSAGSASPGSSRRSPGRPAHGPDRCRRRPRRSARRARAAFATNPSFVRDERHARSVDSRRSCRQCSLRGLRAVETRSTRAVGVSAARRSHASQNRYSVGFVFEASRRGRGVLSGRGRLAESARPGPRDFNERTGCVRDAQNAQPGSSRWARTSSAPRSALGCSIRTRGSGRDGVGVLDAHSSRLPALRRGVGETFSLPVGNLTDGLRVR